VVHLPSSRLMEWHLRCHCACWQTFPLSSSWKSFRYVSLMRRSHCISGPILGLHLNSSARTGSPHLADHVTSLHCSVFFVPLVPQPC
jgi:hypothetical protein